MVKKDTKVAVLGAGAMGCLFGGLMAEKGLDVTLIDVWKEHVDSINSKRINLQNIDAIKKSNAIGVAMISELANTNNLEKTINKLKSYYD